MKTHKKRLKVGIIGCGAIGTELARACFERFKDRVELVAICDLDLAKAAALVEKLPCKVEISPLEKLIKRSELVIEAASARVAKEAARRSIEAGKDVLIMSVGGLVDAEDVFALANRKKKHIFLPSGALCGLDGVKSASIGKIGSALLITRKPPKGLADAPYIKEKKIDLNSIKEETVIFEGNAKEAIKGFPANVNVAATLSLAGVGPEKTKVKIITSPGYTVNSHEIILEGDFGRLVARTENVPSLSNPKTSYLAALSAVAVLKSILNYVKIGN